LTDTVTGHGSDPVQALHQLTTALRERPGRPDELRADREPGRNR
jgi:hypothetical protein